MASYLLDTNVVLRLIDREDPQHKVCRVAVDTLIEREDEICLAPQVLVEFWVAATRPRENNGFGWLPKDTDYHIGRLCDFFRVRPERSDIFARWRKLVTETSVCGKHAHDARLAAFMLVHNINTIVTLNAPHFRGFGVTVLEPNELS